MAVSGTSSGPEVLVELDRRHGEPLHRQLTSGLRDAIRAGRLRPDSRMPSSRVLASDVGVSRRLVVDTYAQLIAEGFLVSRHGAGTFVARIDPGAETAFGNQPPAARYTTDFSAGVPDLRSFPRNTWLRALRQGLADLPSESLGYPAPQGLPETRQAIADYLRRTRGVVADPEHIVLCCGATQGIGLVAQVLRERAGTTVAMEDPGFWLHRLIFRRNGIETIPVEVDEDGLDVTALGCGAATAVLTTPSHQCPTGVVMTAARRTELLDWAQAGNLIIEDDYDAEYRYDRQPVGALQGLTPERVIYIGSASKILAPGLRMGWLVAPSDLVDDLVIAKSVADAGNSAMDQVAFAHMMKFGEYDRHLRQMRRRYLPRRNALLAALAQHFPEVSTLGAAAGVQLMAQFPDGYDIGTLIGAAAAVGIRVESTRRCYLCPTDAPPGLLLGYANLTESQIETGIATLARVAQQTTAPGPR